MLQARELLDYRSTRRNMSAAIDLAGDCVYILNLAIKAQEQIDLKKYFSALKVGLDQENTVQASDMCVWGARCRR